VDNLVNEIDIERETTADDINLIVDNMYSILRLELKNTEYSLEDRILSHFKYNSNDYWTVLLWDNSKNQPIYNPQEIKGDTWNTIIYKLTSELSSYRIVTEGRITAIFGINNKYIDELVKAKIIEKIRTLQFEEDSYIWINEILNYEGGDNYAIRKVHPNMPETEGMYLSTSMTDIKGEHPYQTELDGVKQNGELFFTYYFKKYESDEISKKLTYAKLYKDFDWVIAMGIHLDDMQTYIDQTTGESKSLASRLTIALVFMFFVILFLSFALILGIEKMYHHAAKRQLESEVNHDPLTKAYSRRYGDKELNRAFKEFKQTGISPCIMLFDLDYFKKINDTYGHAVGDLVLIEIVNCMNRFIRRSDKLIRWGGDEFIAIFNGLQKENAYYFGEKLLTVASAIKVWVGEEIIYPTISIGVSYFEVNDLDYTEALKRADDALYQSKTKGRKQTTVK
jgi:diguanylate cyclase (GGDEF)-like protein